jgi:NitT/TauT family transport system substrate-binding protein
MKKVVCLVLGLLILSTAFWVTAKKEAQAAAPLKKIRVADANSTHHLNLYVAKEKGIFEKHGLDVEITQTSSGVAAVIGGEQDIVFNCPTGIITPIAKGQNITIIGQVKIPCTSVLVVPVSSPYKTPADIKEDQQIAGLSTTCCAVILIRDVLRNQYKTDFELVTLAAGAAIAALDAGQVKGAILEEPFVALALLKKDSAGKPLYKTIFDGYSDADGDGKIDTNLAGENPPCRTINANTDFLAANTDSAKAFIAAIDEADRLILENPVASDIVDIAAKYVSVERQAIINSNPKLGFTIHLATDQLKGYADALVRQGTIEKNPGDGLFAPQFKGITW